MRKYELKTPPKIGFSLGLNNTKNYICVPEKHCTIGKVISYHGKDFTIKQTPEHFSKEYPDKFSKGTYRLGYIEWEEWDK